MTHKDTYIHKIKLQLAALNASMDQLQAKSSEARADARAKYQEEMATLQQQSTLALARLDEVKATTEESWKYMVVEMEKIHDALRHSFSYFKSPLQ
jgi:predicted  nucleic acid-binding Zn-ribbon protein